MHRMKPPCQRDPLFLAWAFLVMLQTPLLEAYGFSKCILTFGVTGAANCTGHGIVNIATAIHLLPNSTSHLDASRNRIDTLETGVFAHLASLLELSLASNQIGVIQSGAFQYLAGLRFLDLSYNRIHSLDPLDFAELQGLRVLQISHNNIVSLQMGSLKPLVHLQELDLSFNRISEFWVVAQAIKDLTELTKLQLNSNNISDLSAGQNVTLLPTLQHLNLAKNQISTLDLTNYSLPSLQYLNLTRNNMSAVNVDSFRSMPSLEDLVFDENPLKVSQILGLPLPNLTALHWSSMWPALGEDLNAACQLLQTLPSLTQLDIQHCKIAARNLSIIGRCSNLSSLYLTTTPLRTLKKNALQTLGFLETLYLNKCKIKNIPVGAFTNLTQLRMLVLERNQLSKLEKSVFRPLKSLYHLDLSKNYLTYINPQALSGLVNLTNLILHSCKLVTVARDTFMYVRNLTFLDLSYNSLSMIKDGTFNHMKKLESLLLVGNKISAIKIGGFKGLSSLRSLSLSKNYFYKLSPDRFRPLKSLTSLDLSKNQLTTWNKVKEPSPFLELGSLKSLDLSYQKKCEPVSASSKLFEGLKSLESLNMRGNPSMLFQNLSLKPLVNLTELDMSDIYPGKDGFITFTSEQFRSQGQLRHLKLESNSLIDLPEDTFVHLASLESLSLRYNILRNISHKLVGNLTSLTYLDLYRNPLLCSCENYWFQNWSTNSPQVQVPLIRSFSCFGKLEGDINFTEQDLTFCDNDVAMCFFLGTFMVTLLTMTASIVTVKLRWVLFYSYCMLRAWCAKKFQKEVRVHQYDAFVSCCSEDETWVMDNLLLHLEEKSSRKYRLCFKPRDFLPGEFYIDSIQNAINNSRKTLCVVSMEYLTSHWCRLEIELACSRVFYQHEDVLIVVFLEDIPNYRLSAYHRMRKLMRRKAYITWPEDPTEEDQFWMKLQTELDSGESREEAMQLGITD